MSEIIITISYFIPLVISLVWFIYAVAHDIKYDCGFRLWDAFLVFCVCLTPALNVLTAKEAIQDLLKNWR